MENEFMRISVRSLHPFSNRSARSFHFGYSSNAMEIVSCPAMGLASRNIRKVLYNAQIDLVNNTCCWLIRSGLGPNQVCTLYGSPPGGSHTPGASYIDVGYDLKVSSLWRRNLPVLIGFFVFFQITQALAIEFFPVSLSGV